MTWAKVDDRLYDDPRFHAAGLEAMGLFLAALSYMGAYLTDGEIGEDRIRRIAGRRGPALTEKLIGAGWWERREGGKLRLISWDIYLLSRAEVEAERARKSEAGRRGAERTNAKRLEFGPAGAAAGAVGGSDASRTRDPDPVPSRPVPSPEEKEEPPNPQGGNPPPPPRSRNGQATIPFGPVDADPPPPPPAEKPRDVDEVFAAYLEGREKAGLRGSPPVLDDKRRKLIRARLKDFSLDDLRDAARGIWAHPWNREQRQTALELALRDAGHVERFRDVARAEAPPAGPRLKPGTIGPNGVEVKSEEEMDRVAPFRRPQPPRMPPPATPEQLERTYRRIVDEQNAKRRLEGRPLVALRNGTIVELAEGAA